MAEKKVIGNLKLRIPAGRATAGPPVGSTLGQWGLNMMDFINPFNESFNKNEPVLEILGLKLYLDDLIILGLLFLLYTEDVHDDILFLTLILLLIS